MNLVMHTGGIASTNSFLIADEDSRQAVIFDAPDHTVDSLLEQTRRKRWNIVGLWLTHGHFDHIADHKLVTDAFPDARVLIHPLDEPKLQNPLAQARLFGLPFTIAPRSADAHVNDGDRLLLGDLEFEVIHTPGHAPGHVMYHLPSHRLLVGGDLIIMGAIGRTDLPDSDHSQLEASIRRIMKLPVETQLLPGHGTPTTLAHELQTNLYVQEAMERV